jgi:formylglycine-generating enzyme required for sulfatase activity
VVKVNAGLFLAVVFLFSVSFSQAMQIPSGIFTMGTDNGSQDESPAHPVKISGFHIDAYETTVSQYDSCVQKGKCSPPHFDDGKCIMWTSNGLKKVNVPQGHRISGQAVTCVDWTQASQYCKFRHMRIPTEAEWEYAAVNGGKGKYSWGDDFPDKSKTTQASNRQPSRPGAFLPDSRGLYDMTGNVWEWTYDRYQADYYSVSEKDNPRGPAVGRYRVIRGGGWYSGADELRLKNRHWMAGEYGEVSVGIRCVK